MLLFLAGCSTAPLANFLDLVRPGRLGPEKVPPYGGVGVSRPVGGVVAGPLQYAPAPMPGPVAPEMGRMPPAPVAPGPTQTSSFSPGLNVPADPQKETPKIVRATSDIKHDYNYFQGFFH